MTYVLNEAEYYVQQRYNIDPGVYIMQSFTIHLLVLDSVTHSLS